MRRATIAIRTIGTPVLAAALGFLSTTTGGQETLPVPAGSAAQSSINAPHVALHPHPPKPSVIQVLSSAKRGFCAHLRASPICQLADGLLPPLSTITGGMIPAEKSPHPEDQAQPGPAGTAAQIKAVRLQAPKRQAAVNALQGIDVRYHPEAEAALIGALRADPSACVRLEAAKTILTLPVCTQPISEALLVCVAGTDVDGNPGELNEGVRMQANIASINCQSCTVHSTPSAADRPEYPTGDVAQANALMPIDSSESMVLPISSILLSQPSSAEPAPLKINSDSMQPLDESASAMNSPSRTASSRPLGDSEPRSLFSVKPQSSREPKPRNLMDVFRAAAK